MTGRAMATVGLDGPVPPGAHPSLTTTATARIPFLASLSSSCLMCVSSIRLAVLLGEVVLGTVEVPCAVAGTVVLTQIAVPMSCFVGSSMVQLQH